MLSIPPASRSFDNTWVIRLQDGTYLQPGQGDPVVRGGPLQTARTFKSNLGMDIHICVHLTGGRIYQKSATVHLGGPEKPHA